MLGQRVTRSIQFNFLEDWSLNDVTTRVVFDTLARSQFDSSQTLEPPDPNQTFDLRVGEHKRKTSQRQANICFDSCIYIHRYM